MPVPSISQVADVKWQAKNPAPKKAGNAAILCGKCCCECATELVGQHMFSFVVVSTTTLLEGLKWRNGVILGSFHAVILKVWIWKKDQHNA